MSKKLVVITGANGGMGTAIAKKFSANGYKLLLLDIRIDEIRALDLPQAICTAVDISDRLAVEAAIRGAEEVHGHTDCLVNCAGILRFGQIETQDPKEWDLMFKVNVFGVLNTIKAVLPKMIEGNTGTIINIGSLCGIKGIKEHTVYGGTKYAVHGIAENVRLETAMDNVRVTTIAPGAAQTSMINEETREWAESIGGALSPESIADTVYFIYQMPQNVCIREVVLSATKQEI